MQEILVVDDEADIAALVEVYLTNEGFCVQMRYGRRSA